MACSAVLLAGCLDYRPHVPAKIPTEARRDLGCLVIGISVRRDRYVSDDSMLAELVIQNQCDGPTPMNIRALDMWAVERSGEISRVSFYDPHQRLGPLHVETQGEGREFMRIDNVGTEGMVLQVCFDVSRIGSPARPTEPICFGLSDEPREGPF